MGDCDVPCVTFNHQNEDDDEEKTNKNIAHLLLLFFRPPFILLLVVVVVEDEKRGKLFLHPSSFIDIDRAASGSSDCLLR